MDIRLYLLVFISKIVKSVLFSTDPEQLLNVHLMICTYALHSVSALNTFKSMTSVNILLVSHPYYAVKFSNTILLSLMF